MSSHSCQGSRHVHIVPSPGARIDGATRSLVGVEHSRTISDGSVSGTGCTLEPM